MHLRTQVKRTVKRGAGLAAVAATPFVRRPEATSGCILAYHRVANLGFVDPHHDDWNVAPDLFERQLRALLDCADVVPLAEMLSKCQTSPEGERPIAALTFDDGYANFRTQVLPILERYGVPATVFVVTSLIGSEQPPPFDAWSIKHWQRTPTDAWRPMNWIELERCVASGLVSVGGHSHRHLKAPNCSPEMLAEEAGLSREILLSRLGDAWAYAYPYGSSRLGYVPTSYVRAVSAAGYCLAVTTDVGRVSGQTDPYLMPRLEANGIDSPAVIQAKVSGTLAPFRWTDRLRQAQRPV